MKGYKGFAPGLVCRGKQYAENAVFEEKQAAICESGMHFCANLLDVLDYYPLINDNGKLNEFAEVEALDDVKTDDNKKFCTKKLKICAKLTLSGFIKAAVDIVFEKCKDAKVNSGYYSQLAASGYYSQLAASGDSSQLAASGYSSQLAASGYYSQLAASGNSSKLAASGDYSQLAASGGCSQLAASGDYSQLAASGDSSQLAASGGCSQLAASGGCSVVAGIGINNRAKAALGCWIALAEWEYSKEKCKWIPVCVKAAQVDGERIKPDTWYALKDGEFVEVPDDSN